MNIIDAHAHIFDHIGSMGKQENSVLSVTVIAVGQQGRNFASYLRVMVTRNFSARRC